MLFFSHPPKKKGWITALNIFYSGSFLEVTICLQSLTKASYIGHWFIPIININANQLGIRSSIFLKPWRQTGLSMWDSLKNGTPLFLMCFNGFFDVEGIDNCDVYTDPWHK